MQSFNLSDRPRWTLAAQQMLKGIPFAAQLRTRQRIEAMARKVGIEVITADWVERSRIELEQ